MSHYRWTQLSHYAFFSWHLTCSPVLDWSLSCPFTSDSKGCGVPTSLLLIFNSRTSVFQSEHFVKLRLSALLACEATRESPVVIVWSKHKSCVAIHVFAQLRFIRLHCTRIAVSEPRSLVAMSCKSKWRDLYRDLHTSCPFKLKSVKREP